jgi:hypothetical protein
VIALGRREHPERWAYFDHFAGGTSTGIGDWLTRHAIERSTASSHATSAGPEILEIGPGHGEFAARLMAGGYKRYDVVEPNETLHKQARRDGRARSEDLPDPRPRREGRLVRRDHLCDVFEHLNDTREASRFIARSQARAAPGGIVFILSPDLMDWREDFYNCDFSHSNPHHGAPHARDVPERRAHHGALAYSYSGFSGPSGSP